MVSSAARCVGALSLTCGGPIAMAARSRAKTNRATPRYFFGVVADACCFVNLMVIDFFSPEPSFMNSVNV
jgi:hypothetical protein